MPSKIGHFIRSDDHRPIFESQDKYEQVVEVGPRSYLLSMEAQTQSTACPL